MNSPRRIRRQARRMRRYGMQPMVIATLGRWVWRYRSPLCQTSVRQVICEFF
jgi:hypothetical protein